MRIFVFGSNLSGIHGAGAAKFANLHRDAEWGVGEGITGRSYALPTKERNVADSRSLFDVKKSVDKFLAFAEANPQMIFSVTRVGCGLAGFTDEEIGPMFKDSPNNCEFDPLWSALFGYKPWMVYREAL
jgi:hypothetical protein